MGIDAAIAAVGDALFSSGAADVGATALDAGAADAAATGLEAGGALDAATSAATTGILADTGATSLADASAGNFLLGGGASTAATAAAAAGGKSLLPSIISGASSALGNYFASANQASAANNATAAQLSMFGQTQTNLLPFIQSGQAANQSLVNLTGAGTANPLTSPLLASPTSNLSEAELAQTPGYQFNLYQGLNATQNSAAARGLGTSGNALAGAADYATGLADSTYQNQFNNAVTNQTNQFNRLLALSQTGQNSAANLGTNSLQTASNIGSNIMGAANAQSAAAVATSNNISQLAMMQAYLGNGMYGNTSQTAG